MIVKDNYVRFSEAPWFPGSVPINTFVGGAGGIGSWLAFFLSRIGYTVTIMDFDIIEAHNLGGQLFTNSDIGKHKVNAVKDIQDSFAVSHNVFPYIDRVTRDTQVEKYVFSAFDNMVARRELFEAWKKANVDSILSYNLVKQEYFEDRRILEEAIVLASSVSEFEEGESGLERQLKVLFESKEVLDAKYQDYLLQNPIPIFIDGRLEMEQLQIFCVTPDKMEEYEKTLFDDAIVEDLPCTMKQTSHSAAMIASLMTSFFTNHITNVREGMIVREVPFYHEFFIPMGLTNNNY